MNPRFKYTARGIDGRLMRGEIGAANEEDATKRLQDSGIYVISLSPLRFWRPQLRPERISVPAQERIFLLQSWAMLLESGLSLQTSLMRLRARVRTASLIGVIDQIQQDIDGGSTLSEALRNARIFPPLFVAVMTIGEQRGELIQPLKLLHRLAEEFYRLRQQLITMMIPPLILMVMVGFWGILFVWKILPNLLRVTTQMGAPPLLPSLLSFTKHMLLGGLGWLLISVGAWIAIRSWKTQPERFSDLFKIPDLTALPVAGPFFYQLQLLAISMGLQLQVDAGIPLAKAFETLGYTMRNQNVRQELLRASSLLEEGIPVPEVLAQFEVIPPTDRALLVAGTLAGTLPAMLESIVRRAQEELLEEGHRTVVILKNFVILGTGILTGLTVVVYFGLLLSSLGFIRQAVSSGNIPNPPGGS